jgi:hypothetical protein
MQSKLFLLLTIIFFSLTTRGQDFKKWTDNLRGEKFIRYYNINTQLIIQKTILLDSNSTSPTYQIGLIAYTKTIASDDFMLVGGQIIFDDNTTLTFNDPVFVIYHYSGKHEFSLKHTLSYDELKMLQSKTINFFKVYEYENKLDKWQKEDVLKAFKKIVSEQYK